MKGIVHALLPTLLLAGLGMSGGAHAEEIFGLGQQSGFLAAEDFQQFDPNCAWKGGSWGYYSVVSAPGGTCPATPQVRAHLKLPEGAAIFSERLYYYNTTANSIGVSLMAYTTDNVAGTNPNATYLPSDNVASDASGYAAKSLTMTPAITFDTYDTQAAVARQRSYYFLISLPSGTNVAFKGITVGYYRQIAPAPVAAAFSDVPTTHPFFNEIAQLSKSGITLGCGNGQFCPDSPVTRGQMAAFLSRALGLQWDWNTDAS